MLAADASSKICFFCVNSKNSVSFFSRTTKCEGVKEAPGMPGKREGKGGGADIKRGHYTTHWGCATTQKGHNKLAAC